MSNITEGRLTISFNQEDWNVIKYDECSEYNFIIQKFDKIKGVDVIAIQNNSKIFLIEIKDFTDNETNYLERCEYKINNFTDPLVKKITDTLFGSINIERNLNENFDFWQSFNQKFINNNNLLIIFWLDGDLKGYSSNFSKTQLLLNIKRKLNGLNAKIIITDSNNDQNILTNSTFEYN